jgi:hypothetical protein
MPTAMAIGPTIDPTATIGLMPITAPPMVITVGRTVIGVVVPE